MNVHIAVFANIKKYQYANTIEMRQVVRNHEDGTRRMLFFLLYKPGKTRLRPSDPQSRHAYTRTALTFWDHGCCAINKKQEGRYGGVRSFGQRTHTDG